jgi:hypothetical protein
LSLRLFDVAIRHGFHEIRDGILLVVAHAEIAELARIFVSPSSGRLSTLTAVGSNGSKGKRT